MSRQNLKNKEKEEKCLKKNEIPTLIFKYRSKKQKKSTKKSKKKSQRQSKPDNINETINKKEEDSFKNEKKPPKLNESSVEKITSYENEENTSINEEESNVVTLKDDDIDGIMEFIDKEERKALNLNNTVSENSIQKNDNNDNKTLSNKIDENNINNSEKTKDKTEDNKKNNRHKFFETLKRDDTMIKLYLEKMIRECLILEKKKNFNVKFSPVMNEEEREEKKKKLLFLQSARNKILARNFKKSSTDDEKFKIVIEYPKEEDEDDEEEDDNATENKNSSKIENENQKTSNKTKRNKYKRNTVSYYYDFKTKMIYDNLYVMEKYKKKLDNKKGTIKQDVLDIINDVNQNKNIKKNSSEEIDYLDKKKYSKFSPRYNKNKRIKKNSVDINKLLKSVFVDESVDNEVIKNLQTKREKFEKESEARDERLQIKINKFFNKIKELKKQKIEDLIEIDYLSEIKQFDYRKTKEREDRMNVFLNDLKDFRIAKKYQRKYLDTFKYKNPISIENYLAVKNNEEYFNQNKTYINCSNFVSYSYSDDEDNIIQNKTHVKNKQRKKTMYITALFSKKLKFLLKSLNK